MVEVNFSKFMKQFGVRRSKNEKPKKRGPETTFFWAGILVGFFRALTRRKGFPKIKPRSIVQDEKPTVGNQT